MGRLGQGTCRRAPGRTGVAAPLAPWPARTPLPAPDGGGDIDHLLIGPGGAFSINTKNVTGQSVWVGDTMVRVDHGPARPYAAKSRREADHVRTVLERYCGFAVPVEPVLVFVGIAELSRAATQSTVRVYKEREVSALGPLTGALTPRQVELVYSVARHRQAWLTA
ncbi:nuclease-related domain-containing protein [Streptomyces sp. NPDC058301]|uniref:nuclease-related domain-containing protein n=1 Tax=Streptomyces sp. NPDC058301 TaxID=3346436 RepID=UPI0036E6654C